MSLSSITSRMNAPGKKNAKIIPQGMQGASHVHGASKYASGAAGGASVDESEMEGSLPPIMGVMGNNSNKMGMQQTYKYDKMADNKAASPQEEAEERQRLRREAQLQQHPFVRWTTRRGE